MLELFAGGGAWGIGAKHLGWHIAAAFDIDPDCVAIYNRNVGEHASLLNLAEVSNWPLVLDSKASMVLGSPPCPPWSRAGKELGFQDSRSHLMCVFLLLTWLLQATHFGLEQVASFATFGQGSDLRLWTALWAIAGFDLVFETVSAHHLLPIRRDRLLVLGRLREGCIRQRQLRLFCGSLPSRQPCPFARGFVNPEVCPPYSQLSEEALALYLNTAYWPTGMTSRIAKPGKPLLTILHSYGEAHTFGTSLLHSRGLHGQLINSAWFGKASVRFLTAEEVRRLQCFPFGYGVGPRSDPTLLWSIMGNALPLTFVGMVIGSIEADLRQVAMEPLTNALLTAVLAAVWTPGFAHVPSYHGLFPLRPSALSRVMGQDYVRAETTLLLNIIVRIVRFLPEEDHQIAATTQTQLGLWNIFQALGPPPAAASVRKHSGPAPRRLVRPSRGFGPLLLSAGFSPQHHLGSGRPIPSRSSRTANEGGAMDRDGKPLAAPHSGQPSLPTPSLQMLASLVAAVLLLVGAEANSRIEALLCCLADIMRLLVLCLW